MHEFNARIIWDGNLGDGTSSYAKYGRQYRTRIEGKPDLHGSAAPEFRGEAAKHNPEDLFVTAIAACHMLSYLALCAKSRISVLKYEDQASGTMSLDAKGGGRFEEVVLRPAVTIAAGGNVDKAIELHHKAHELCFIANSCSVPIRHEATVQIES
ncbi:MAG: OsmC family protein [Acidobacteriota bacterium]